ncbi:hypothetical protein ACFXI0_38265 [Kitasatospora indigofera]|uniref:hypothetical protein n=1 Tax=Kitasatospora indigofera TaxID=67307 RepID=UPI00368B1616
MKKPIARLLGGAISTTIKATGQPRKPSTLPARLKFWLRHQRDRWRSHARRRYLRALGRTIGHNLVRGIATGLGTTLVTGITWWIHNR